MTSYGVRFLLVLTFITSLLLSACQNFNPLVEDVPGRLTFNGPNQETVLTGEFMPGTGIQYVGSSADKGAELRIDGQLAFKQTADSVDWEGSPISGANLSVQQRVLWHRNDSLGLGGTVSITVEDPMPQAMSSAPDASIDYSLPATYNISIGQAIPGTHLVLQSIDPDKGAEFVGWYQDQYGFRQLADSVEWDGSLRPGIAISQRLRVAWIGDDEVQLAGVVHLLLSP